jgi:GH35 family endo-1,4-beta-xylanase
MWETYPEWFINLVRNTSVPIAERQEKARQAVKAYIVSVMSHFKGRINKWVVVNEFHPLSGGLCQ